MILRAATRTLHSTADLADRLLLFTAPLLTDWALDIQAGSYSTDIGAAVLTVLAACYFIRTFTPESRQLNGLLTTLLAASAIAAKSSNLFLCASMITVTLLLLRKQALRPAIAAALILLPWLARETLLTGYPLYPFAALSLPVDWRMPPQKVEWLRHVLLNWARWLSYDDTQGHRWLPTWLHARLLAPNNLCKCLLPALIALPALLIALLRRRLQLPLACFLACIALAAIAWYFYAPDPRYASQLFTLLMGAPLAALLTRRSALLAAAALALIPLRIGRNLWIPPAPGGLFHPTPTSETQTLTTPTGLTIRIPVPRPGSPFEDRVWNAPLPAAPMSEINPVEVDIPPLHLRHPPVLQDGFTRAAVQTVPQRTPGGNADSDR